MECCSQVKYDLFSFCLVLVAVTAINDAGACSYTFTAGSGSFRSPNYPSGYSNRQDCTYRIQVSPGNHIVLTFHDFRLETRFDFVKIFDGDSDTAPSLGRYTGSRKPSETRTTQNKMLVRFTSDGSNIDRGFNCSYFSVWNRTFTALSGTFHSPNYPSSYGNNQEVFYLISMPLGYHISLTFQNVSLQHPGLAGCQDFVEIFDGNSSISPSLGRFCGTTKPADKRSTHHDMLIRFLSDPSTDSYGFNASYLAACDRNFTALTGNLRSPNYPSGNMNNQDCSFLITVPPDYRISLTFQHFILQPNSSSGCLDYVEIFDGGSSGSPSLGHFCGPKEPTEDKRTTQNEMLVHFHTDSSLAYSGFDASYHSECHRVFTTMAGSVHSPDFPSTYSNNQDCDFLISVPRGYRIALTFLNFSLEAGSSVSDCHDFVEIYDGSSRRAPLLGRHCGTEAPIDEMRTTQHEMLVRFHTDNSNVARGFNASYSSGPGPVDVSKNEVVIGGALGSFAFVVTVALIILVVLLVKRKGRKEAEPLALSEIHARPISNVYLPDTTRETEQEEDAYENAVVEIRDEHADGVCCKPTPSDLPNPKAKGQRRLHDNRGGAAQNSKPTQEDVSPSQPAVQEPLFPCEGDYDGLCRTQADADVNEYGMPPQTASGEPAKYPDEDLYMNM